MKLTKKELNFLCEAINAYYDKMFSIPDDWDTYNDQNY